MSTFLFIADIKAFNPVSFEYYKGAKEDFKNRSYNEYAMVNHLIVSKDVRTQDHVIPRSQDLPDVRFRSAIGNAAYHALNEKPDDHWFLAWKTDTAYGIFSAEKTYTNSKGKQCRSFMQEVDKGDFKHGAVMSKGEACKEYKGKFLVWNLNYYPQSTLVTKRPIKYFNVER